MKMMAPLSGSMKVEEEADGGVLAGADIETQKEDPGQK